MTLVRTSTTSGVPALDRWHPGLHWAGCSILAASAAQMAAIRRRRSSAGDLAADVPAAAAAHPVCNGLDGSSPGPSPATWSCSPSVCRAAEPIAELRVRRLEGLLDVVNRRSP